MNDEDRTEIDFICSFASGEWKVVACGVDTLVSTEAVGMISEVVQSLLETRVGTVLVEGDMED